MSSIVNWCENRINYLHTEIEKLSMNLKHRKIELIIIKKIKKSYLLNKNDNNTKSSK